ncbi:hypothetical protein McanMca71_006177 [Microsporum canis]|uniref:Uncharacterized protein n=1 Tax=Arthroderma otae (strain ATCC MYA-4605 / CBS 113480) TaxID=554155 RepID=C5FPJ9_ARTOC|nr:conserved hypothetical protein [Microsporum canis CBS 113480]EEQ31515.1 conserved hypothetical protein [Microsporum canis CBS 113480]
MTTPSSIPRFLLPRGGLSKSSLERIQAPRRNRIQPSLLRRVNFSSSPATHATPTKPRVLEKPDKFRPPSHPARRVVNPNKMPRNYPGPAPTPKEIAERKTKRYPNMFPPEGTVLYKFLTNKGIHVWISMSVLFSLAYFTWSTNFKRTSPYAHLLPGWSQLLSSPISTISQFFTVMKMHAEHTTVISKEKRKRIVDDIDKRKEYRIAHGLEEDDRVKADDAEGTEAVDGLALVEGAGDVKGVSSEGTPSMRKPKRWLGIW